VRSCSARLDVLSSQVLHRILQVDSNSKANGPRRQKTPERGSPPLGAPRSSQGSDAAARRAEAEAGGPLDDPLRLDLAPPTPPPDRLVHERAEETRPQPNCSSGWSRESSRAFCARPDGTRGPRCSPSCLAHPPPPTRPLARDLRRDGGRGLRLCGACVSVRAKRSADRDRHDRERPLLVHDAAPHGLIVV